MVIQDTDPHVFVSMLEYIYTGRLPRVESAPSVPQAETQQDNIPSIDPDTVVDMLLAADRFLLDDLKQVTRALTAPRSPCLFTAGSPLAFISCARPPWSKPSRSRMPPGCSNSPTGTYADEEDILTCHAHASTSRVA